MGVWHFKFYGFVTKKKESLKAHLAHRHDVGIHPFQNKCDSKEAYQEALEALEQPKYVCFLCDSGLNSFAVKEKEDLLHHLTHDHAIIAGLYECPYCDYKSEDRGLVRDHIWNTHIKSITVLWEKDKCPSCDFKAEKVDDLSHHLDITH